MNEIDLRNSKYNINRNEKKRENKRRDSLREHGMLQISSMQNAGKNVSEDMLRAT